MRPKTHSVNLITLETLTLRGRTYAKSSGRMLLFVVRTYDGDHWMYALQTVLADVHGTTGRNTWMYKTPSGLMSKDHRMYARVAGRPLLCQKVGGKLSL
jgi:hypothetical protein